MAFLTLIGGCFVAVLIGLGIVKLLERRKIEDRNPETRRKGTPRK